MSFSKKCTALLLAFFLMFSNIGLALNIHFCGEKQITSQVVYSKTADEPCSHEKSHQHHSENEVCSVGKSCCGSSENHSECCKDEYISQDSPDVITTTVFSFVYDVFVVLDNEYSFEFIEYSDDVSQNYFQYCFNSNAPPFYKLYCSLIYYA
ncbi:MAG: hypothetical protein AB7D46_04805 [Flavobacteriaceae bacterium]